MNELEESDEDINAGDLDDDSADIESLFDDLDELSLWGSDEEREQVKKRKAKDAKINNSFTGPYPLDPTDFNHTDKGPSN